MEDIVKREPLWNINRDLKKNITEYVGKYTIMEHIEKICNYGTKRRENNNYETYI